MTEETEYNNSLESEPGETPFQKGMRWLRANKEEVYQKMEEEANDPETQAFYANPENTFDDVDPEILDDYD